MSELAERVVRDVLRLVHYEHESVALDAGITQLIEQALLAERRLAMESAITISQAYADRMRESLKKPHLGTGQYNSIAECKLDAAESITDSLLRAAAEKEVVTR